MKSMLLCESVPLDLSVEFQFKVDSNASHCVFIFYQQLKSNTVTQTNVLNIKIIQNHVKNSLVNIIKLNDIPGCN